MAQHDYNLSNNTGALYRADNNAALNAIATINSGATEPAVKFPGMLWLDLSGGGDGVVRRRNQANSAWLTDIGQDATARAAAAAAQTTADAAVKRAGDTMTGPLNLPGTEPTNNNAVSRAQADTLYQVKLPATAAGSLLVGTAAGWSAVLAPAANDNLLTLSGGVPTWSQGATVASPNAYVRTKPDGTIDATFIPSVAAGLKFRGTFKPAVNVEYPTTGGSGAAGAPAVGDFWVIDGLTTGGYTYLTGTLAGVTVYNGDSIAKSDGANWYRMGSTVEVEGYLRIDGTSSMAGNLEMAANEIHNVSALTARAGPPVPLSNFSLDATNVIISPQRGTTGPDLAAMVTGQIGTDLGRMQLYVGASGVNAGLIPIRHFSSTAAYAAAEYVINAGQLYKAKQAISAGAFTPSQWAMVLTVDDTNIGYVFKGGDLMSGNLGVNKEANEHVGFTCANFTQAANAFSGLLINAPSGAPYAECRVHNLGNATLPDSFVVGTVAPIYRAVNIVVGGLPVITLTATFLVKMNTPAMQVFGAGGTAQLYDTRPVAAANGGRVQMFAKDNNGSDAECASMRASMTNGVPGAVSSDLAFAVCADGVNAVGMTLAAGKSLTVVGNITAANFPASDRELKENIVDTSPRDFAAMPFHEFNFKDGNPRKYRGPLAQDVLAIAPDHVFGEPGSMTLNYGSLAIEMALNALQRIEAIEAAMAPPAPEA